VRKRKGWRKRRRRKRRRRRGQVHQAAQQTLESTARWQAQKRRKMKERKKKTEGKKIKKKSQWCKIEGCYFLPVVLLLCRCDGELHSTVKSFWCGQVKSVLIRNMQACIECRPLDTNPPFAQTNIPASHTRPCAESNTTCRHQLCVHSTYMLI